MAKAFISLWAKKPQRKPIEHSEMKINRYTPRFIIVDFWGSANLQKGVDFANNNKWDTFATSK